MIFLLAAFGCLLAAFWLPLAAFGCALKMPPLCHFGWIAAHRAATLPTPCFTQSYEPINLSSRQLNRLFTMRSNSLPRILVVSRIMALLTVFLLAGCASKPTYEYDFDRNFDFSGFKTYRWYDDMVDSRTADYRQYNSSDDRVREAVGRELRRKGIVESKFEQADFWINYIMSKQEHRRVTNPGDDGGMYGGVGAGTYGRTASIGYSTGASVRVYKDGTAILDVIDVRTRNIVWRGVAEGRLKNDSTASDKRRATAEVAATLLKSFPPAR